MSNRVFGVALKAPGLGDSIKVEMRMSKLAMLFLARSVDYALGAEVKKDSELLVELSKEMREDLLKIKGELLGKAGLAEFYDDLIKVSGGRLVREPGRFGAGLFLVLFILIYPK